MVVLLEMTEYFFSHTNISNVTISSNRSANKSVLK